MSTTWLVVGVTVIGGIAAALQAQFAGAMDSRMGTLESVFVTYGTGAILIAVAAGFARGGNLAAWRDVPPYAFLAGMMGLVVIGAVSYAVGRVGVVQALLTFTIAQFLFSAFIDHFGWFGADVRPFDVDRVLGVMLLFGGAWLVLR